MTDYGDQSLLTSLPNNEMVFNPFRFRKKSLSYYPFVAVSPRRRMLLHTVFWTLSLATIILFISFVKPFSEALLRGTAILCCLIMLLYGTRILVLRYYEKRRYGLWVALSILLVIFVASFRITFDLKILHSTAFKPGKINNFSTSLAIKLYTFFFLIGLIFIILASLYYIAKNRLSLEYHYFNLKLKHAEAQLSFLKAQVNPHFLFNTLNNIYAAAELKNASTPGMILQLSQLLRYITYNVQQKKINLVEEWEQVDNYVQLFCSKNPGLKHPIELKAEGQSDKIKIPPMLLLPLVENAIKYSDIHEQNNDSFLKIFLYCKAHQLEFIVVNTYSAYARPNDLNGGIGNQNIRQRLELEYPGQFTLHTEKESRFFTAILTIHFND